LTHSVHKPSHLLMSLLIVYSLHAQSPGATGVPGATQDAPAPPLAPLWQFGGFADVSYLVDFNDPSNHLFRSRGTTYIVDKPVLDMAAVYLQKNTSESSRWGLQMTWQAGQDSRLFAFSSTAPNLRGAKWLRHLGPTNISYLAPFGKGLALQAGVFTSFIGYDSLYAKDNFNYTRPWSADFTPYLMMGINGSYPLSNRWSVAAFLVNGYWHLAHANNVPSFGGQLSYKPTSHTTLKQTLFYGPHQRDTAIEFWRFLSDSIAEWRARRITAALEYHVGTERIASQGNRHAVWMGSQLPLHLVLSKRWSVTERAETYWDPEGRITGHAQTVVANTETLEYRLPYHATTAILRLEHRVDDSNGPGGGFFYDGVIRPAAIGLKPVQHLLAVAVILTLDSAVHPSW
jgi:hypothetical protein